MSTTTARDVELGARPSHPATTPTPWGRTARSVLLLAAALGLVMTAFAWPAVRSSLHGVPLAVAGPAPAVAQLSAMLDQQRPGAFDVRPEPDEASALAAIRNREVYGAVVVGAGAPAVLTASAASPTVAQALGQLAAGLAAAPGSRGAVSDPGPPAVRDVVAAPAADPHGAGLAAGALPLVVGGILTGVALTQLVRGPSRRVSAAVAVAVLGGLAMTSILHAWLGSLTGPFLVEWGVISLAVAATSVMLLGLHRLFGPAGLAAGGAVLVLVGNPLSGLTSAPQMLPGDWGTVGQLLPPGATGSLLRAVSFFHGAGAAVPVSVLGGWLLLGAVLVGVAGMRASRRPV